MRPDDERLFERGNTEDIHARILVTHFSGAMDAGIAGRMAISQMLRSLSVERILTFDSDQFIDYRSHRPIMTIQDWVTSDMEMPEIVIDRVLDDLGNPILVLHGPEPDARWESFARIITEIAKEAGVEISVSLHGIPSGVPHTRPTPVHFQATDSSLIPSQPRMANIMQFPAPMTSFLQTRLSEESISGLALLAAVPFYTSDSPYPAASSALLTTLSDFADLSLPVGDLEQGAAEDQGTIAQLVAANPEIMHTVEALEKHYDAWTGGATSIPLGTLGGRDTQEEIKDSKDIGDVIEAYLANITRLEQGEDEVRVDEVEAFDEEDPLQAALRRVELRRADPEATRGMAAPRHRAAAEETPAADADAEDPSGTDAAD